MRVCTLVLVGAACVCANLQPAFALQDTRTSEDVAESLESIGDVPWYDPDTGDLRPVEVDSNLDDTANRSSRWLPQPERPRKSITPKTSNNNNGSARQSSWSLLWQNYPEIIAWSILVVLVVVLSVGIVWAIARAEAPQSSVSADGERSDIDDEPTAEELAKLEHLQIDAGKHTGNLLERCDLMLGQGNISEAIVYLFGHRLLQLDRAHAIRLARGKTNRQYLRELRTRPNLRRLTERTVNEFERSFFGRHELTPEEFQSLRADQTDFDAEIASLREAA